MGGRLSREEFLREIYRFENPPSISDLTDALDLGKSAISRRVSRLEEKGLIRKEANENGGSRISIYITEAGKNWILDATECPENVNGVNSGGTASEDYEEDRYFIHNFRATTSLRNREMLDDSWIERAREHDEIEYKYISEFDHHHLVTDSWLYRITQENVTIRVREEIRGSDVRTIKDRMMDRVREGIEFIETELPLVLSSNPHEIRVQSQHIGVIGHHLARYLDEETDHNVTDFRVRDDEGELLIWIDRSHGRLEKEAGNGGSPSGMRENAEDDMAFLQEWTYHLISNKNRARTLFGDLEEGMERLDDLGTAVRLLLARELRESRGIGEFDSPVQELYMRYWRDPEYSRPFFHKDSGGLMAFRSDGSGCEKILSGEEVERLS